MHGSAPLSSRWAALMIGLVGCSVFAADGEPVPDQPSADAARGGAPNCALEQVLRDGDGDGVSALWSESGCDGRLQQEAGPDCDDADPTRFQWAYPDRDADGWTFAAECVGELPGGYVTEPGRRDCDDDDAGRQQTVYLDQDGDLAGLVAEERCVAAIADPHAPPPGVSIWTGDCDDTDPSRYPSAFEQWRDGIDSDCRGDDDPVTCPDDAGLAQQTCGCGLLQAPPAVAIELNCAEADLFLAASDLCRSCNYNEMLVIGNRGTTPVVGGFELLLGDERHWIAGDLAPGSVSLPLWIKAPMVEVASATPECDTSNNRIALQFQDCRE